MGDSERKGIYWNSIENREAISGRRCNWKRRMEEEEEEEEEEDEHGNKIGGGRLMSKKIGENRLSNIQGEQTEYEEEEREEEEGVEYGVRRTSKRKQEK